MLQTREKTTLRMEEIANETTDKGLLSKIYKQYIQLNTREANNSIKKWGKDLNRYFSKEDIQMANKHIRRGPTLLIFRENTNQNYNEISPTCQNGHNESQQTINAGEGTDLREPSCTIGGKVYGYSHYGRWYGDAFKN